MTLVITSRPITSIDDNNVSKWNAAFSPIIYTGIRKGNVVNHVSFQGIPGTIFVSYVGNITDIPEVGSFVYLNSGVYDGSFKVLSALSTLLILEAQFTSISTGGYVNLSSSRKNYHIELEVYKIIDNAYSKIADMIFKTLPDGTFSFDLSSLLRRNIIFTNTYQYVLINEKNLDVSVGFNFRMKEVWQGSDNSFSNFDEKDVTYYVGAAKQLRDQYGTNMALYVPITGTIGLFNGDFNISNTSLDGWSKVDGPGTSALISGGKLLYQSTDQNGFTEWTSQTELVDGTDYEIDVDKDWVSLAEIKIIAGTNEVTLSSSTGRQKISITANGTEFKIRIDSKTAISPHEIHINSITIYLSESPQLAKFLVDDFEPTYFKDYPMDLSFLHSDNLANLKINRNRRFFDQNLVELSVSIDALEVSTNNFAVNRMLVGSVPVNTKFIDVWLTADEAVNTGYIDVDYIGGDGLDTHTTGTHSGNPPSADPQKEERFTG